MKGNCQGPCLPHCLKEEKFIYLIIGFLVGIVAYEIINRILSQIAQMEKNKKNNQIQNTESQVEPNNLKELQV